MPLTPEDYLKIYIKNPAWSKVIKKYRFKILKILQGKKPNKIFSLEISQYFPNQIEQLNPEQQTLPPYRNYLHEPKQIVQIKDILNALYYTELAFAGLESVEIENTNLSLLDTIHFAWDKITEYICQANYLITHLDIDFNSFLGPEINFLKQCLSSFQALSDYFDEDKMSLISETVQNTNDSTTELASLQTPFQLFLKNFTRYDNEKRSQDIESLILYFETIKTKAKKSGINQSITEFESIIKDIKNIPNILTENPEDKASLDSLKKLIERLQAIKTDLSNSVELTSLVEKFIIKLSNWLDFKESFLFEIYFKLKKMAPNSFSYSTGQIAGNIVEQLHPGSGKVDYQFLTTKAAAIPALVESITQRLKDFLIGKASPDDIFLTRYKKEQTYQELDFFASTLAKQNFSDLKDVANNLFNSIESLQSDDIFLPARIFYYVSVLRHTITLAISTFEHLADLNGSSQATIKHLLGKIKYEYLIHLFSLMDRLEDELMLKPSVLSKPMMASLKEFFELITSYINMAVDFSEEEKSLLIIEDPRFVLLRIQNTHRRISLAQRKLNIDITQAETAYFHFFSTLQGLKQDSWVISIPNKQSLLELFQHLKSYFDRVADGKYSKLLVQALGLATDKSFYSLNTSKLGYAPYEKLLVRDIFVLKPLILDLIQSNQNTQLLHIKLNSNLIETILANSELKVSPLKELPNAFSIDEGNVLSEGSDVVSEFYEKQDELTEVQKAFTAFNHFFNILKRHEFKETKLINLDLTTKKQLLKDYLQFKPYILTANLNFFTKNADPILEALQKEDESMFWQILPWQTFYSEILTLNDMLEIESQVLPKIKEDLEKENQKRQKRDALNSKCNIIVGRNVIAGGILTQQKVIIRPENCPLDLDQLYKLYEFYIHKEAQIDLAIQAYNEFMGLLPAPDSNSDIEYLDELRVETKEKLLRLYGRIQIYYLSTFQSEEAHAQMKNTDNKIVQALKSALPLKEMTKRYKIADFYTNRIGELLAMSKITFKDRATTYQQLAIQNNVRLMKKLAALQKAKLAKTAATPEYEDLVEEIAPIDGTALISEAKIEKKLIKSTEYEMYNALIKRISQERNLEICSQFIANIELDTVKRSFLSFQRIVTLEESIIKLLNKFNGAIRKEIKERLEKAQAKSNDTGSDDSRASVIKKFVKYIVPESVMRLITLDFHPPFPEVEDEKKREEQSKQTRGLKELFNILYFLKLIFEYIRELKAEDLENLSLIEDKIGAFSQRNTHFKTIKQLHNALSLLFIGLPLTYSDKIKKIDYSTRLITIYFHLYRIQESLKRLYHDPHYQFLAQQLGEYTNELVAYLKDKTKPYQTPSQEIELAPAKDVNFEVIWYLINAYALAPLHIKALSERKTASKEELDIAHKQAKDITRKVEDIIKSSSSYLKLLFKTPKMYWLFQQLKTKFIELTSASHRAVIDHIKDINDNIFTAILITTDEFEDQLKLRPGLLTTTMQQLLQIFYEGLLEPLNFNHSYYLTLLTSTKPIEKRLQNNAKNRDSAEKAKQPIQEKFDILTELLTLFLQDKEPEANTNIASRLERTTEYIQHQFHNLQKTFTPFSQNQDEVLFLPNNKLKLRQALDAALPILLEEEHLFEDGFELGSLELSEDIFKLLSVAINKKQSSGRTFDLVELNKILLILEEEYSYIGEQEVNNPDLDTKVKEIRSLQRLIGQYTEQKVLEEEPRDQNYPLAEPQIRDKELLNAIFNYLLKGKTKPKVNITCIFELETTLKNLLLTILLKGLQINFKQLVLQDKIFLQKSLIDTLILRRDLQKKEHQKRLDKIDLLDKKAILNLSFKYLIHIFIFLSDMNRQQKAEINRQKANWIAKLEILVKAKKIKTENSYLLNLVINHLKQLDLSKERQITKNLKLATSIFRNLLPLLKLNDDENAHLDLLRAKKKLLVAALQKQSNEVGKLNQNLCDLIISLNLKQTLVTTLEISIDILNDLATAKSLDEFTKVKLDLASKILLWFKIDKYQPLIPFINAIKASDDISEARSNAFELTMMLFVFIQGFVIPIPPDLKQIEKEIDDYLPIKNQAEEEYQLLEKAKQQILSPLLSANDLREIGNTISPLVTIKETDTNSLEYLIPFIQKLLRIYQGRLNSSEVEKDTFEERNTFLQQEKKRQDKNNQRVLQRLIKKEFILIISNLDRHSHALLNFEPIQIEYQTRLKTYLETQENDIRIKAKPTSNVKQAVNDAIYMHINQFERQYYQSYLHLDKIAAEITNFQDYLTKEIDKAKKQEPYLDIFEDSKVLKKKKEKIDSLYNIAIDSSLKAEDRIHKIHTNMLAIRGVIEQKVNHENIFLWIKQWVLSFLERLNLYTRESLVHYNKVINHTENKPSFSEANSRYSLFSSRKKIASLQEWHDLEQMEKINPINMLV